MILFIGLLIGLTFAAPVDDVEAQVKADGKASLTLSLQRGSFGFVEVWIDSGGEALAAYQIDINAPDGDIFIVGIEGGEHRAFRDPPYYDPAAMRNERVIIGDFDTAAAEELPSGRTRVATIHVQAIGDQPRLEYGLEAAATVGGAPLQTSVELREGRSQ